MAMQCPHCGGQMGFLEQLVGKRVGCPHCHKDFTVPPEETPSQPKQEPAKPQNATALLEQLLAAATEHNRWCAVLNEQLKRTNNMLDRIQSCTILLCIIAIVVLCCGFGVTIYQAQ